MEGPQPVTDHDFLVRLYSMMGIALEAQEKHEKRICDLELGQHQELSWRNKLVGAGIAASVFIPLATALAMKMIG